MARATVMLAFGAAAIVATIATAVLLFIFATLPSAGNGGPHALVLASAIIEVALCLPWTILVLRCRPLTTLPAHGSLPKSFLLRVLLLPILTLVLSLAAAAVVGAAVGQLVRRYDEATAGLSNSHLLIVTLVVWAVSVLAQAAFLLRFVLAFKTELKTRSPQQRFSIDEAPQEMRESSRPATATTIQSNPFHETTPSSPPSRSVSDGDSPLRSSFSTIQRPGSSKRGLLIRQHSQPRHSARSSSDGPSRRPSQDEGFDAWDTSGVSSQMREAVLQCKAMGKTTGLPTIPGSRSPSPAKALEGPFFDPSPEDSPPQSPLPQPSVSRQTSPSSSPLELPNFATLFPSAHCTEPSSPPPSSPPQSYRFSRPASLSQTRSSEDHIHPLFRTSSPTPPPSASSNTIVTAAPEAGQFVTQRTFRRIRSGSLPANSSPLVRSESYPDIRDVRVPLSPVSVNVPSPASSPRGGTLHLRKRSASFETAIIQD